MKRSERASGLFQTYITCNFLALFCSEELKNIFHLVVEYLQMQWKMGLLDDEMNMYCIIN